MPAVFLTADPHFGHEGICKFTYKDQFTGEEKKVRPFDNAAQMNDFMVTAWNETVRPNDKVYLLGDVAMRTKHLDDVMPLLHGDLVLIKGNHDIFKPNVYRKYFRDVRAYHVMNGCLLSHIPIHKSSIGRFGCNIHGHTHQNQVVDVTYEIDPGDLKTRHRVVKVDPDYICVSVEQTDFKPILFEKVMTRIVDRGGQFGFRSVGERIM